MIFNTHHPTRLFALFVFILFLVSCTKQPEPQPYPAPDISLREDEDIQRSPRHGVAGGAAWDCQDTVDWDSRWLPSHAPEKSCEPTTGADFEVIPMAAKLGTEDPAVVATILRDYDLNHPKVKYVLFYNECELVYQCNQPPEVIAEHYYDILQEYYALGGTEERAWNRHLIGGFNWQQCGLDWMQLFMDHWETNYGTEPPRYGYHVHSYPDIKPVNEAECPETDNYWAWAWENTESAGLLFVNFRTNLEHAVDYLTNMSPEHDKIWLSEMGCLAPGDPSNSQNAGCKPDEFRITYMKYVLDYLYIDRLGADKGDRIERYAWYTDDQGSYSPYWHEMWDVNNNVLTPMGEVYVNYKPSPDHRGYVLLPVLFHEANALSFNDDSLREKIMTDIDVSMLLVPAGVSLVIALLVQFLVKPWLKIKYKDENHEQYSAMLNTIALVGGVVLGLLGAVALNWGELTASGLVTAGLVGLFGGAAAIGGAEFLGNSQKARQ